MDFHIDRTVWPRSDNSVVASRYHSSADKAAGDPEFPQISRPLPHPEQTTRRKRKRDAGANGRQPDVKEVIPLEDIYMFAPVPDRRRVLFSQDGGMGAVYLFMNISAGYKSCELR
ncbi:hypothetical protein Zmor_001832 [Zophobas morio]|uniref:Uncharacterized protein n=1 Tax=Zophobas morio TaxID=2755281 RepID=A0AA38J9U9_9CUCU|nr:hypothetical protein Zmor_001832 [Zophobas morio]